MVSSLNLHQDFTSNKDIISLGLKDQVDHIFTDLKENLDTFSSKIREVRASLGARTLTPIKFHDQQFIVSKDNVWLKIDNLQLGKGTFFRVTPGIELSQGSLVAVKRANPGLEPYAKRHLAATNTFFSPLSARNSGVVLRDLAASECLSPTTNTSTICVIQPILKCDLFRAIRDNLFNDEPKINKAIIEITRSIKYIHEKGAVNGDIKPENIGVTRGGVCVLSDHDSLTRPDDPQFQKFPRGTNGYLAPEALLRQMRIKSDHPVGFPVDLWAFGLVAYQLITKKGFVWQQFADLKKIHVEVTKFVQEEKFLEGVPETFHPLLKRLLVIDPRERATVNEVFEMLNPPSSLPVEEDIAVPQLTPIEAEPTELDTEIESAAYERIEDFLNLIGPGTEQPIERRATI